MAYLLRENDLPLDIEIHSDPLSSMPAALSTARAFKKNKAQQEPTLDNIGGAAKCRFCNPDTLDGHPPLSYHLNRKVMSFPNSAPYLPGDQRVLTLWHDNIEMRHAHAHRFRLGDFDTQEFYFLVLAAVELAEKFPNTPEGSELQQDVRPIRCIAGFNLGTLAGQSVPHFHLQYGWDLAIENRKLGPAALKLYYEELDAKNLVLFNDEDFRVVVPWTPRGNLHLEIHVNGKYELRELTSPLVGKLAYVAKHILQLYQAKKLENVNILFSSSPYLKRWQPLVVHFVPRANVPALYEMIGVNVVDTPPDYIRMIFETETRWRDLMQRAKEMQTGNLYEDRFPKATAMKISRKRVKA